MQYVVDLLTNNPPEEQFVHEINAKHALHEARMKDNIDYGDELTQKDFDDVIIKLRKKAPEKYNFLLKAGESMKRAIFKIFKYIYDTEKRPEVAENEHHTVIQKKR